MGLEGLVTQDGRRGSTAAAPGVPVAPGAFACAGGPRQAQGAARAGTAGHNPLRKNAEYTGGDPMGKIGPRCNRSFRWVTLAAGVAAEAQGPDIWERSVPVS